MGKLAETFQKRLRSTLAEWGSVAPAAERAGMSRQTFDHWLRGSRIPDLDQLEAAANALGKDPIDLLFGGQLPRAPKPSTDEVVAEFVRLFGDLARTKQGAAMLSEALSAALKSAPRTSEITHPKEK